MSQGQLWDWRRELESEPPSGDRGLVIDLFAGGGGASAGIEAAVGRAVDIAINHDPVALAVHKANHPNTVHLEASVWEVRPQDAVKGRPVDLLWASPDCTHFSAAKGDVPRRQDIRSLAWVVIRWAKVARPRVIYLENVTEFQGWGPLGEDGRPVKGRMGQTFKRWTSTLRGLGYTVDWRVLDASEYGTPTKRRRLFLIARCDGQPISWPAKTHGEGLLPLRSAAECIDWSIPAPSIFGRTRPLAEKTQARIAAGIQRYVMSDDPFIVGGAAQGLIQTGWGERKGQRPRYLNIHEPLGTVPAGGVKHALVSAFLAKHFGGVVGTDMRRPVSTVTAKDHHALTTAQLVPEGEHQERKVQEVRAFLTAFYGSDGTKGKGQDLRAPMRTVTSRDRLGLVTVAGQDYQIIDIGMRMLEPHELLRAQFGKFAEAYDMERARTKTAKVRLIGNSVCPEMAEAIVAANRPTHEQEVAA